MMSPETLNREGDVSKSDPERVPLNMKARALGIMLPPWRDALERYLKEKYGTDNRQ